MAYQRHDENCNPAPAPQPYQRHDENCNPAVAQPVDPTDKDPEVTYEPSYTEATDTFGNTYRNYNSDYVKRDVDNNPV
jgi:hypothetical protein